MIKNNVVLALSALIILSCKKEKLTGESKILVGKWQWVYSMKVANTCNPPTYTEMLTPQTLGDNYSIHFIEKGKVEFTSNNQITKERITNVYLETDQSSSVHFQYTFVIFIKTDELMNKLSGLVGEDSLLIRQDFPFVDTDCENYTNYFVRE